MLLLTKSILLFVNLLVDDYESNSKKSISSTVKGWAAGVHEKTVLKSSPGPAPQAKPLTVSMIQSSEATKVNTLPATTGTQCSVMDAGITTKFGGFNLNSDSEQETPPFDNKEGKLNDNIALVCTQ